jgi:hypothetical protein
MRISVALVVAGLVPTIHVFGAENVDARHKAGTSPGMTKWHAAE